MSKVVRLLKSIDDFIKKAEEDNENLTDVVPDFPGLDRIPQFVEDYEKKLAKQLRAERKLFLDEYKSFIAKDEETLATILNYFTYNLFAADEFAEELGAATAEFLQLTVSELSSVIMESIDKDIAFNTLSQRTVNWIERWSNELAELMKLKTHSAIENILREGIENGSSIQEIERKLADLPQFSRKRARNTAITEVLTASSVAQYESYMQSPAVIGKQWKHSGSKGITPRENHQALDGVVVPVDEKFNIPDSTETAMYPRDTNLTAKERINCHCALGPVVDNEILGLSKEEKEAIRQQVLYELNN